MIYTTKIYMPDKEKFKAYIDGIYESRCLTNNGPLVQRLEKKLEAYLGVKNLLCISNGTDALQLAYRLLEVEGEVVTTPFSFVSTTSAIVVEGLIPVFADIDGNSYNIDPKNIESVITEKTCAIAPCHVFGNACQIDVIDKIARRHNLKVIYDASHAFDVKYKDKHILNYGDISIISFHATKLFHTIEGAAIVIKDDALYEKAKIVRNCGIDGPDSVVMLGVNARMNEVEAAMGLCMLEEEDIIQKERKASHEFYTRQLKEYVQLQKKNEDATQSYTYFPVVFKSEDEMNRVREALLEKEIAARQYFKPSLDTLPYIEHQSIMVKSRDIASRILVVPMHSGIEPLVSETIIETLKEIRSKNYS
ncbi:DegT/DnrJ/EryC1/StrS family aminotransferase [Sulfurovum sp. XGS-02]|uniref:DegT/DnrJ/EryC1/StrS family aminotransferase n=1 Tax=Sulfurovum sp. XGS-02 TaxID=2925411 RepID=UPI00204E0BA1|nr:DegT/DnrJ/EryC1/StrS family aminotransferase [Sulfurovum sp. XGS-02]UPT76818.1 DegT/DnrJ/EryC1/StrS family aminotransferase [Sulfurovum sp. XGS-02]